MPIERTACDFFESLETGVGALRCKGCCFDGATFSRQADVLGETTLLERYGARIGQIIKIWNNTLALHQRERA